MSGNKPEIKFNIWNRKSIPIYLFFVCFLFVIVVYLTQETVTKDRFMTAVGYLLIWTGIVLYTLTEIDRIRNFFKKFSRWINGLLLVIAPMISFLMVEFMVSNYNKEMFKLYSFIQSYLVFYHLLFDLCAFKKCQAYGCPWNAIDLSGRSG